MTAIQHDNAPLTTRLIRTATMYAFRASCFAQGVNGWRPREFSRCTRNARHSCTYPPRYVLACAGKQHISVRELRSATGVISVDKDEDKIAVGDTLRIEYTPEPESPLLESAEAGGVLLWTGGFNGWRGTDDEGQTLAFPMTPLLNGSFRVGVTVPDYAKSLDFAITDHTGYLWDDNNGNYYSILVRHRKRVDKEGKVEEYIASDGKEYSRDISADVTGSQVLRPGEEQRLQEIRGEAALVGEEQGLGNVLISQARDVFERFDHGRTGYIAVADIGKALSELCFDLEKEELAALTARFVANPEQCSMVEWMLMYSELELSDHGIEMV